MHSKGGSVNPAGLLFRDSGVARALTGPKLGALCTPNPCKMIRKMDAKIDAEKIMKKHEKETENTLRIDYEINDKCVRLQNPQILEFVQEYNVKTVFAHDRGCRK